MRFTKWALPIVKERVPNYNLEPIIHQPRPIIYTCDEFTVFDIDEYKFYGDFLFVVANNIDYSLATHAICLEEKKDKKGYWKVPSKKILNLNVEQIKIIKEEVKKYVEKIKAKERNIPNKKKAQQLKRKKVDINDYLPFIFARILKSYAHQSLC